MDKDFGRCLRPALARLRRSARCAVIGLTAIAIAGCNQEIGTTDSIEEERGLLRALLAERCMENLPEGPRQTHYSDWDEVVNSCSQTAYYQSNGCENPSLCIRVMFPSAAQQIKPKDTESGE